MTPGRLYMEILYIRELNSLIAKSPDNADTSIAVLVAVGEVAIAESEAPHEDIVGPIL